MRLTITDNIAHIIVIHLAKLFYTADYITIGVVNQVILNIRLAICLFSSFCMHMYKLFSKCKKEQVVFLQQLIFIPKLQ